MTIALLLALLCSVQVFSHRTNEDTCDLTTEYLDACGRKCERTCENAFLNNLECSDLRCSRPACKCKKNLVRHNNVCIKKEECPRANYTCPRHESLNYCGNGCELTCQDVIDGLGNKRCPNSCDAMACACMAGFARLDRNCVRIELCNARGSRYRFMPDDEIIDDPETYPTHGSRNTHHRRNQFIDEEPLGTRIDPDEARRRLSIKASRTTSRDGCPDGEVLDRCGRLCEATCNNTRPECPRRCSTPACVCREGLVRNQVGYCVRQSFCTPGNMTCPKNERLNPCGSLCELKCSHVIVGSHPSCPKQCLAPACTCKDNFARSADDNTCVTYETCDERKRYSGRYST